MKILIPTLFFAAVCVSCDSTPDKVKSETVIVKVAEATQPKAETRKEFSFIAKPFRSSELSFRVGGPIDNFDLYVGTFYEKGKTIAEVDARDFSVRRERAEAVYNQAKSEFERIKLLYEKDNISASSYEKASADFTTAKTNFETAVNELTDTRLTAPFNGYVEQVYIEKHQSVRAAEPVISFVDIDKLKIEVYVSQDIAFNSQNIKSVSLTFDAMPEQVYSADVVEISKSTTRNNLSYMLTALLPNKDRKLLSGMSGKVFFELTPNTVVADLVVPMTAVCHRPTEGDYVWVVDEASQKVSMRRVKCGDLQQNGMIAVKQGIEPGETIAVSGLRFLSDDMQVQISK